ncbi:MAG: hypothetical protein IBJ11_12360 [Phycisphaerales bacterium]|nr:hypothetical protein [Phycisphaerales bacterium]
MVEPSVGQVGGGVPGGVGRRWLGALPVVLPLAMLGTFVGLWAAGVWLDRYRLPAVIAAAADARRPNVLTLGGDGEDVFVLSGPGGLDESFVASGVPGLSANDRGVLIGASSRASGAVVAHVRSGKVRSIDEVPLAGARVPAALVLRAGDRLSIAPEGGGFVLSRP